mgnify:CR=1 FL=1
MSDCASCAVRYRAICASLAVDEAAELGEAAAARAKRFTWRDGGRQLATILERYGLLEAKR